MLIVLVLAWSFVLINHWLTCRIDLNIMDEGYLWYGTQRTAAGHLPIRDFRAYDPARYYWCAAWMRLLGRHILGLRRSLMLVQGIGLSAGMATLYQAGINQVVVGLMGVVMVLWLYPRHKAFESTLAMVAVWVAFQCIDQPTPLIWAGAGVFVGFSFVVGLNHGVYNLAAWGSLWLVLSQSGQASSMLSLAMAGLVGGLIGSAPLWLAAWRVDGWWRAYRTYKIDPILKRGTTNLHLPIPWVWEPSPLYLAHYSTSTQNVIRRLYTFIPLTYLILVVWLIIDALLVEIPVVVQDFPLMVASTCVGLFYLHHAMSRAGISHLSQSIHPWLLAMMGLMTHNVISQVLVVVVLFSTVCYACFMPTHPWVRWWKNRGHYVRWSMGEIWLRIPATQARYLTAVRDVVQARTSPTEPLFLAPTLVGIYALLGRQAPMYDTFSVYPAPSAKQQAMLTAIQTPEVRFVLINNSPLDKNEDLRFANTHPLVWEYVQREFQPLALDHLLPDFYCGWRDRPVE